MRFRPLIDRILGEGGEVSASWPGGDVCLTPPSGKTPPEQRPLAPVHSGIHTPSPEHSDRHPPPGQTRVKILPSPYLACVRSNKLNCLFGQFNENNSHIHSFLP